MVTWINLLNQSKNTPEEKVRIYKEQMANWYVICSVTGEQIPLSDLHYWNVETNAVYKSPQVMPLHDRYQTEVISSTKKVASNSKKNKKRRKRRRG